MVRLITESPMPKFDAERTWNGFPTKMLAEAAAPGNASTEVTVEVVLVSRPTSRETAVTLTLNVQDAPAASVAPVIVTRLLPAVAVVVPPPQLPTKPLGLDTSKPAGKVSENVSPVRVRTEFGFRRLKVRLAEPPGRTVTLPKLLLSVGGFATNKVSVAVPPDP